MLCDVVVVVVAADVVVVVVMPGVGLGSCQCRGRWV